MILMQLIILLSGRKRNTVEPRPVTQSTILRRQNKNYILPFRFIRCLVGPDVMMATKIRP